MDKFVGAPLCVFFGLLKVGGYSKEPKRVLVIQLWGIGETVLTLPSIEALKKLYPSAKIDILTTERNKEVYYKNKDVNKIKKVNLDPFGVLHFILKNVKRYDIVIDMEEYLNVSSLMAYFTGKYRVGFSHGARSIPYHRKVDYDDNKHCAETFLDLIRILGTKNKLEKLRPLNYSSADKTFVDSLFRRVKIKKKDKLICIAPGAAESAKCRIWPVERFAGIADYLVDHHHVKILFTGTENEKKLVDSIIDKMKKKDTVVNLTGKMSLNQFFYSIKKCNLFIGNDSGPMHIAAAQGVRTIGLFGPNLPKRFGPYGKENRGIYKGGNCEFSPCINVHLGEVPDCLYPRESQDYQKCMKNISVGDVIDEVEKMLK